MVTRLLHGCGLYLGPKDALMPPQADNPDGFWEHLGFVALNDELLEGARWRVGFAAKDQREFIRRTAGSVAYESAAPNRGLSFGTDMGLEGSPQ